MTNEKAINIASATIAEMDTAEMKMQAFYPFGAKPRAQSLMYQEGLIKCSTCHINGKPTFTFFWYLTFDRGMVITGAACLLDGYPRWTDAVGAAECLAKIHGCNHVMFASMRAGMSRKALASGFIAEGVLYKKDLCP